MLHCYVLISSYTWGRRQLIPGCLISLPRSLNRFSMRLWQAGSRGNTLKSQEKQVLEYFSLYYVILNCVLQGIQAHCYSPLITQVFSDNLLKNTINGYLEPLQNYQDTGNIHKVIKGEFHCTQFASRSGSGVLKQQCNRVKGRINDVQRIVYLDSCPISWYG